MLRTKRALFITGFAVLMGGCGAEPEGTGGVELAVTVSPSATYTLVGVQSNMRAL